MRKTYIFLLLTLGAGLAGRGLGAATPTETASPTLTRSPTPTISPTFTITPTFTASPTFTNTPIPFEIITVYPNPVVATGAKIALKLPYAATVEATVYSLRGEVCARAQASFPSDGLYEMPWDARSLHGGPLAFGEYYLRLHIAGKGNDIDVGQWISVLR